LQQWLPDDLMQRIAAENNLSETAFFVRDGDKFKLRWMTPTVEVDLCGHATLATAAVLFFELGYKGERVQFETRSGIVAASRQGQLVELDFPVWEINRCAMPLGLSDALGGVPKEVFCCERDFVAVFGSEEAVRNLAPDMDALTKLERDGVIATARSRDADFVSRYFGPRVGIPEDPVTGSAHCALIPYWAERLAKQEMFAKQISKRGGELHCRERCCLSERRDRSRLIGDYRFSSASLFQ
jgi:PhzF family phenazine biosynthesis protein